MLKAQDSQMRQVEDNADDFVHIFDDASGDSAVNGQERRFNDIDFQHAPETAGPISVECKPRLQRAVKPLQDNPEIQLDKGVQGQIGKGLDQNIMKTRVEVALRQVQTERGSAAKYRARKFSPVPQPFSSHQTCISPTSVMTSLKSKQVVNVNQKPMLKIKASVSSSIDNPEIREQIVEKNYEDLSETAQRTISDVDNDFLEFEGTSEDVTVHYLTLQKR
ncbi:uncharacterized protein LOC117756546 [Scomber scombrus]|uniref:Uncharacterized protein LOC117756546 n=1 Tax=Scomber scombrus TaxID=13677 RepID=A0AAV1MYN4_SCOSC